MNYNSDFKYDLKVGQMAELELGKILTGATIEVKSDLQAKSTGNVFIEYHSRGKASGIATTESDFYALHIEEGTYILIETEKLKEICRKYKNTERDVMGGDNNTSKGILLPLTDLVQKKWKKL